MWTLRLAFTAAVLFTLVSVGLAWQYRPLGWSSEAQVTDGLGDARLVDVLADPAGATIHLVWEDNRDGIMQVFYQHSLDDGVTWGHEFRLTHLTPQTVEPIPRLASNGKTLFVFFSNRTDTGEHLFYVLSNDEGSHFSDPTQFTTDAGDQSNAVVAADSKSVHVVWQGYLDGDEHIYYARSLDSGLSWQSEVKLTAAKAMDRHPTLAAIDGKVFVLWSRMNADGSEAVFFRASYDDGETWQVERQISAPEAPVFQAFPSIAADGKFVYAVWNGRAVTYARSNDTGLTWDPPILLTNTTRQYLAPRIAVDGAHLDVVTAAISTESVGRVIHVSSDVYVLESSDMGVHWSSPFSITDHPSGGLSLAPSVSAVHGAKFIAWEDNRNGAFAVFFASNPDYVALNGYSNRLTVISASAIGVIVIAYLATEARYRLSKPKRRRRRKSSHRRKRRTRRVRK